MERRAELREGGIGASGIFPCRAHEDVEVLCRPKKAMRGHGVAADDDMLGACRSELAQEICEVPVQLKLHRARFDFTFRLLPRRARLRGWRSSTATSRRMGAVASMPATAYASQITSSSAARADA